MDAQPPDAAVHLRLKCPDAEDFVERFAPNVTRGGIFLPTRDAREVGSSIHFEVALLDDTVVLAGDGVVTWAKPKGMGVKFTTLNPSTEFMLERLLSRREASAAAPESPGAEAARPTPAGMPATGMADISTRSFANSTNRPLVRVVLVCLAVFVGVAVIWMSVGRARVGTSSSHEPAKPAAVEIAAAPVAAPAVEIAAAPVAAPAVEIAAAPVVTPAVAIAPAASPAPAPEPPAEAPSTPPPATSAATERPARARSGGLRVEKMRAGTSYKNFTCPNPATRFSAKASKTVNVCLQVAHKPGKTDHLTLVWERNGGLSGKTHVEVPSSKSTVRTRARMRISAHRVGSWSVRVLSDRNASLGETTFDVVP
jgi:Tfp pilus assembly protein PilZ